MNNVSVSREALSRLHDRITVALARANAQDMHDMDWNVVQGHLSACERDLESGLAQPPEQPAKAEQPGDVDPQRDFEETLKYSEYDRSLFAEQAVEKFKYQQGGFDVVVHPEYGPAVPDEWHDKVFARVHMGGEAEERDAGLPGWEALCLSEDQSGTVLADLIAALTPSQAVAFVGYCDDCGRPFTESEKGWSVNESLPFHTPCASDAVAIFDAPLYTHPPANEAPAWPADKCAVRDLARNIARVVSQMSDCDEDEHGLYATILPLLPPPANDEAVQLLRELIEAEDYADADALADKLREAKAFLASQQEEKGNG